METPNYAKEETSSSSSSLSTKDEFMKKALKNAVILQEIFKYTKVKQTRLVCKYWNEVIFSLPEPKLSLALDIGESSHTFCNTNLFQTFVSTMNPKLARRLDIQEKCRCPQGTDSHVTQSSSELFGLPEFCNKFSEFITTFKVIGFKPLIPVLHNVLRNSCPNLTRVDICILGEYEETLNTLVPGGSSSNLNLVNLSELPIKSKLKSVVVHVPPDSSSHVLPQQLINSSPSLEKLRILGNWYPHLSSKSDLHSIFYTGTAERTFSLESLSIMLEEVAHTLQHLEVGMFNEEDDNLHDFNAMGITLNNFKLSDDMPKLKYFKCYNIDIFFSDGESGIQQIPSEKMPNLETLDISAGKESDLLSKAVQTGNPFAGVRTLLLSEVVDPISLVSLRESFPVLEHLKLISCCESETFPREILLKEVLKSCAPLRLKHLSICLSLPSKLSQFIQNLEESGTFYAALKTLNIAHYSNGNVVALSRLEDDLPQYRDRQKATELIGSFKNTLLQLKGLSRVTISGLTFCGETALEIMAFIVKNQLPVEFNDC